ncbi:MAG: Cys-tRNA(Pro) deacylase [Acidimicrobiia bacterium]
MPARTTRATLFLERMGIDYVLHEYVVAEKVGEGYGEAVAVAIGLPPGRVFKTLVVGVDEIHVVAVVPVSARLSTRLLARAAGSKRAEMVAPAVAERLTGYVTGGISPFGQKGSLDQYVDESAVAYDTVAVSGGMRGIQLEVSPHDLVRVTNATVVTLVDDSTHR